MPIYEYICSDCDQQFEKLVFKTKEKIACPQCGGQRNKMLLSVVAAPAKSSAPAYCETGGSRRSSGGGCDAPGGCGCA